MDGCVFKRQEPDNQVTNKTSLSLYDLNNAFIQRHQLRTDDGAKKGNMRC